MRRLVLVGFMVLAQGSMQQLLVGALLSAMFLLLQVQASPFREMPDDFLASSASFCLVAVFVISIAFKDAELTGLPDIQAKLSIEQREIYVLNQGELATVLMVFVAGTLLVSFLLFVVLLGAEAQRRRQLELANRSRRLRLIANSAVVMPPQLPTHLGDEESAYHLFLSHVWGTGQDQMRIIKQRLLEMVPGMRVFLGECIWIPNASSWDRPVRPSSPCELTPPHPGFLRTRCGRPQVWSWL